MRCGKRSIYTDPLSFLAAILKIMAGLVEKSICALWRVAVLTVQVGWAPQYTRTKASWTGPELDDVSPTTGLSSDWLFDWLRMARYTEYSLTFPAALDGASHDKWAPSAFWFIQTGNKIKFLLLLHLFCLLEWEGAKQALPESRQTTELWSFRPTAFARTSVDSPDDIQHSTTCWTYHSRCYFSHPWIPHVRSLSFHACSLFSGLKNNKYASGEST